MVYSSLNFRTHNYGHVLASGGQALTDSGPLARNESKVISLNSVISSSVCVPLIVVWLLQREHLASAHSDTKTDTHNGGPSTNDSRKKRTLLAKIQPPPSEPIFGPKLIDCLLPECVLFMVLPAGLCQIEEATT